MKIHLGCGKRSLPGFVHVDLLDAPHIDYRHDVRTLPMFGDDSAELIYACHVLEYFDGPEALDVLREWRRVLATTGVLRVAVPDFAALAEVYRETSNLALIHGPLYGAWKVVGPEGPPGSTIGPSTISRRCAARCRVQAFVRCAATTGGIRCTRISTITRRRTFLTWTKRQGG